MRPFKRDSSVAPVQPDHPQRSADASTVVDFGAREHVASRKAKSPAGAFSFPFAARFAVINLIGLALVGAAWAERLLYKHYQAPEQEG